MSLSVSQPSLAAPVLTRRAPASTNSIQTETVRTIRALYASDKLEVGQPYGQKNTSRLPATVAAYVREKQQDSVDYGFGEPTVRSIKLPSGTRILAVTGIESDIVNTTRFFTLDGKALAQVDDYGGFNVELLESNGRPVLRP